MYLSNNPLWRFAGVLERLAYTVTSDSVVGQRNSSAIGYEFSVLPKFALKVAKLEVEVLRWEGASAEQAAAQAWRSKVVSEMLTVRLRWDELYWDDYAARIEAEEQDADWGDTEDDLRGPSEVLDDDGRDGWCTDDSNIEVAYTWNAG
jgi:hypothetical protein